MSRKLVVLVAALAVVASACGSDPEAVPTPTPRTSTASPTTDSETPSPVPTSTSASDPYAVPGEIDVAYVTDVLEELEFVLAEAMTAFVQEQSLSAADGTELLVAVTTPDWSQSHVQLMDLVIEQHGWDVYENPVGAPDVTIDDLVVARQDCVVARVTRDEDAIYAKYTRTEAPWSWLVLVPWGEDDLGAEQAAASNPTPWRIQFYGLKQDAVDEPPTDECGA